MALFNKQPTANETPDTGQGGAAVTGNTNTGHGNTTVVAGGVETKTCRWSSFESAPSGMIASLILKADWNFTAGNDGGGTIFRAEYSLNGGVSWNTLFNHVSHPTGTSGSSQAVLSNNQDFSQVQVRDLLNAAGGTAGLTGSISNIRLEVIIQDPQAISMM